MSESKAITRTERLETIGGYLEEMQPHMSAVISHGIDVKKLARMAITVIGRNDRLLQCTNISLMGAIMESAQLSLYLDSTILGHAHLVPFKVKGTYIAQLIPGYRGLIELMLRSGRVANVEPRAIFEGDEFFHEYGMNKILKHVPKFPPPPEEDAAEKLIGVYCVIRYKVGEPEFVVMPRRDLEKIRDGSPAGRGKTGPWFTNFVPMCLKSGVRAASKYQALSPDVDRAVSLDETYEAGIDQNLEPPPITIDAAFTVMGDKPPEDLDSVTDDLVAAAAAAAEADEEPPPPEEETPPAKKKTTKKKTEPKPEPETPSKPAEPEDDPSPEPEAEDGTPDDTGDETAKTGDIEDEPTELEALVIRLIELRGEDQARKDVAALRLSAKIPEGRVLEDLTDKQSQKLTRALKTLVELAAAKQE